MRKLILISNDDGYSAKGIKALVSMVADLADVLVCAPTEVRSGKSRAFTMEAIRMYHVEEGFIDVWACDGTPVDCIKMALSELCKERKPDLILGGINHGSNASTNSHYSGTVGIAIEGAMKHIPSIAFSLCDFAADADFEPMRAVVMEILQDVLENGLPNYVCLNVNCPGAESNLPPTTTPLPTKWCRMAQGHWVKEVIPCRHPARNYDYYFMAGHYECDEPEAEDTDDWALRHGYIAITPLTVDSTANEYLEARLRQNKN